MADEREVAQALKEHEVEAVLHFAAYSLVGESMEQPAKYFQNNSAGTLKLIRNTLRHTTSKSSSSPLRRRCLANLTNCPSLRTPPSSRAAFTASRNT